MRKEIEINGCVEIPPEMTMDDFTDEFIRFVESKGWSFGGGFQEIVDGYYTIYHDEHLTSDNIAYSAKTSPACRPVLKDVANLYLRQQIIFGDV